PSSGKNSIVPIKFCFLKASLKSSKLTFPPKIVTSLPILGKECRSEKLTIDLLSKSPTLQFIAGSELNPVSTAKISSENSPKQSANLSNPEFEPYNENQGVQI